MEVLGSVTSLGRCRNVPKEGKGKIFQKPDAKHVVFFFLIQGAECFHFGICPHHPQTADYSIFAGPRYAAFRPFLRVYNCIRIQVFWYMGYCTLTFTVASFQQWEGQILTPLT